MKYPLLFSVIAAGVVSTPRPALPCVLVPGTVRAGVRGEVGSLPLLVSDVEAPELQNDRGDAIEVEAVAAPTELQGSTDEHGQPLKFYRPRNPLVAGGYTWLGVDTFAVTATAADSIPDTGSTPNVGLRIADENEGGGCGAVAMRCGTPSTLEIVLEDVVVPADTSGNYLLTIKSSDHEEKLFVRQSAFGQPAGPVELRFDGLGSRDLARQRFCLKLAGVSPSGRAGAEKDLGCIDPNDDKDTRVTRSSTPGCSAAGPLDPSLGALVLYLAAGVWARGRTDKRRAKSGRAAKASIGQSG